MSTGPKLHHVMAKGLSLACFERRLAQRGVAPTLWLVHATDPQAPRDYCQHGLRPAADGHCFDLACAPAFEVKVYALARQNPGIYASIRAL